MPLTYHRQMGLKRLDQHPRQHRHPILTALAIAYQYLQILEIQVLHPQAQALHQPQSAAI
jgi:hypothetical protein